MTEAENRTRGAAVVGAVLGVLGVGTAAYVGVRAVTRPAVEAPAPVQVEHGDAPCAEGLEPIAAGGCLALAKAPLSPPELVVYFHGLYDKPHVAEELDRQRRVARAATAKGISVLALRGKMGACSVNERYETWWCWPSNEKTADAARGFVASWEPALAAAEERAGKGRRLVLGFSNGAYFASLLAVRGLFDAQAFAIAHGGPVEPVRGTAKRVPLLLMSADDDYAQTEMIRLEDELRGDKWPLEIVARAGGHALTDQDIASALAFFARVRTEKVPLHPPLSSHVPRAREAPRAADAGEAEEPASTDEADEAQEAP